MTGLKKRSTMIAALAAGSLALLASGAQAQQRSESDTATHGAAVSRPMPAIGGGSGSAAGASSGTTAPAAATTGPAATTTGGTMGGAYTTGKRMGKLSSSQVRSMQQALNGQGAHLSVDGRMGPKTRSALMDYQARNNLPVTGRADSATMAKLGM